MSESLKLDDSPQSVIIFSVSINGNIVPGSIGWPIIQPQNYLSPASFWNIIKVADKDKEYYLQHDISKRYLVPGGARNSCVLNEQPFAWKIEANDGGIVKPLHSHYKISEIPKSENVLQSGYPFADPADAFAVVSEKIDKFEPSLASWIIERVPNPLKA